VVKVIWQRLHRILLPSPWQDGDPIIVSGLPRSLHLKQDVDPFSRFCTVRPRDRQTYRLTLTDARDTGSLIASPHASRVFDAA